MRHLQYPNKSRTQLESDINKLQQQLLSIGVTTTPMDVAMGWAVYSKIIKVNPWYPVPDDPEEILRMITWAMEFKK